MPRAQLPAAHLGGDVAASLRRQKRGSWAAEVVLLLLYYYYYSYYNILYNVNIHELHGTAWRFDTC